MITLANPVEEVKNGFGVPGSQHSFFLIRNIVTFFRLDRSCCYKDGCKHINLAANVCGYTPINLGKFIKDGILSDIESIHRVTIDRAVERKLKSSDFN